MAMLGLHLPVFIASPCDVLAERRIAEEEIRAAAAEATKLDLLLEAWSWDLSSRPGCGRPQDLIMPSLTRAELVVVILGRRLGSPSRPDSDETATQEEVRTAGALAREGVIDDVFVYFKEVQDAAGPADPEAERVRAFRRELEEAKQFFPWTYADEEDFRIKFRGHLGQWISRWAGIPQICDFALKNSPPAATPSWVLGENRLPALLAQLDPVNDADAAEVLGRAAVAMYQAYGPSAVSMRLNEHVEPADLARLASRSLCVLADRPGQAQLQPTRLPPRNVPPLVRDRSSDIYFATSDWFFFSCALGLVHAIRRNDPSPTMRLPYMNPIHQYLAALVGLPYAGARREVVNVLRSWLTNRGAVTSGMPITRNFAAYVLGMLGAGEAENELADALRSDSGQDVATYCITSLGKIRSRRKLELLKRLFADVSDNDRRILIAQVVARIVGIAMYEL
jgi:hypothetical protein